MDPLGCLLRKCLASTTNLTCYNSRGTSVRYDKEVSQRVFFSRARDSTLSPSVSPAPVKVLNVKIPEVVAIDMTSVSPDLLQQAFESAGIPPLDDGILVLEDIRP